MHEDEEEIQVDDEEPSTKYHGDNNNEEEFYDDEDGNGDGDVEDGEDDGLDDNDEDLLQQWNKKRRAILDGLVHALPTELETRDNGIWTKLAIRKNTRFGPFSGKWTEQPLYEKFAWQVCFSNLS